MKYHKIKDPYAHLEGYKDSKYAEKFKRIMKRIKDDEDKSKKGDDFPSDGRKKSKRSKRSKRKNKSRKK